MLLLPITSRCQPDAGYPTNTLLPITSRCQPDAGYPTNALLPIASRCRPDGGFPTNAVLPISSRSQSALTHTPDNKFSIGRPLGEGGHGTVHLSTEVATGDKVAIKIIPVQNIKEAAVECTTMGILTHPNILPLQETIVDLDNQRIFLVMELCRGGDLFDLIAEVGRLDEPTARSYFEQMASALVECHANCVYHRDLKPENILLDGNGNIKIADFGLAMMAGEDMRSHQSHTLCGSIPYVAPEVLTSSGSIQYSAAQVDVWSLGIVLFIMLTGKQPFNIAVAEDCPTYAGYLEHGFGFLDSAKDLSGEAAKLLEGMLNPNPKLRLTMSEALASEWLSGLQCSSQNVGKWCEMLGYDNARKLNPAKFSSQATCVSTCCPSNSPSDCEGEDEIETPPETPTKPPARTGQWSSPMRDGDTANDMLVRTLGWVQLSAPKERLIEQVTGVLEGLGVEYSVAQGELSHVVKVQVPQDKCEDGADSPSTCASSDDAFPGFHTHMAGQLSVEIEIVASAPSKTDFHVKRQKGSVLRFHSFYHDLKNQLASSNGWDEKAGRYLRVP